MRLLVECGVDAIGFPLRLAVHAPDVSEEEAARIVRGIAPPVQPVLITYLADAAGIDALAAAIGVRIVQVHGDIELSEIRRLKTRDPELAIVKSLVVGRKDAADLENDVRDFSPFVDAFITDTYDRETGASGATGKTHDWEISRRLALLSTRPLVLAGGLTPENVGEAIRRVRPAGVDSHTGVEDAAGRKDREKVSRFVREARRSFRQVASEVIAR